MVHPVLVRSQGGKQDHMEAKGREGYVLPMFWVSGHRAIYAVRGVGRQR